MRFRRTLGHAVGLLAALSLVGCTLVGWGIGSIADSKTNQRNKGTTPLAVAAAEPGETIELFLRDGSVVSGRFEGVEPVALAEYKERWAQSMLALAATLPVPGLGPVRVKGKDGRETEAHLLGLRPGKLVIVQPPAKSEAVPLDKIASVSVPGGGLVQGTELLQLAQEGRLPFLDAVVVKQKKDRRRVPFETVRSASLTTHHGRNVGAAVGVLIDVVTVAAAIAAASGSSDSTDTFCGTSTCTSCPLVYVDSSGGMALEAEPLGGSLFAADEATDRALLPAIVPKGGTYRLQIRNEQQETDQIDAVRLLAADHPDGVDIVPAMDGTLFAVGQGVAPSHAVDATGANLVPLLRSADRRPWTESPIGRDPHDPVSRRGVAFVDFPRPEGTTSAVLDLTLRSTRWVALDLRDVEGDTLHVRVEAMPGFWDVDRMAVDYAAHPAPKAMVLLPTSARMADGQDVHELVASSDDRRVVLPAGTGRVDLAFAAPEPAAGARRSVLLEMEGYYRPILPARGEPQSALFDRLVEEPGALAGYVLAGVDAETRRVARGER